MRKVLVVDDEKLIRSGIKAMIERKEKDYYEVTLCSNGKEALDLVSKEVVDIVVTDIRMPQMDGITFIRNLKGIENKPAVIILTGHDDFNYALEALKCGAKDYLLKPIKREELYSNLDKIEEEIKNKEERHKKEALVNSYIEDFRSNELNYILINENINDEGLEDIRNRIQLNIFKSEYYVGILTHGELLNSGKVKLIKDEVDSILNNFFDENTEEVISFLDGRKNLVILSSKKDIFKYLGDNLRRDSMFRFTIGLSEKLLGINNFRKAYRQASDCLKYKLFTYAAGSILIDYESIIGKSKEYVVQIDKIEKLANMMGTEREIKGMLGEILNEMEIRSFDISYLEEINAAIDKLIFSNLLDKLLPKESHLAEKIEKFGSIYNFSSYKEYYSELEGFILYINEYIKTMKDIYGDKNSIEKAMDYISNNYYKDLDLAMVSNEVSLNYSYFSQLFKQYTGENFVSYLKKIRVEKAKELLKQDKYKIYEIAKKVGYEDSKQFAKIFRSVTGISPAEFRDKL